MPRVAGTETRRKSASQKELTDRLTNSELLKRLKGFAHELSDTEQPEDMEAYNDLAASLVQPFIIKHKDKDVRLHAACCLLDILRIYAPEAPYNRDQLRELFSLVVSQMKGLKDAKGASFKRYFYVLENTAMVKSFTICTEMEFQDLILELFKTFFSVVNEGHSGKVKNLMLDVMASLIQEAESFPQELLDTILVNIVEPNKSENPVACKLAGDLIQRTSSAIEPYIQMFFNNSLFLGQPSESEVAQNLCDVIFELNKISRTVLLSVLPQLEYKIKSNDEEERLEVTRLLAKMFSDKDSDLALQNKQLWKSYLGRFLDINPAVRIECVKHAKYFLVYHPQLAKDVADRLHERQRDNDEKVRQEFVKSVCEAAAENISCIPEQLFEDLKERLRDKKIQIRKEAVTCIAKLYRKVISNSDFSKVDQERVNWIPDKILHNYYHNTVDDRLCVERVLFGCLVPGLHDTALRMKSLLSLYYQMDDTALNAFQCLLKCQNNIRADFAELINLIKKKKSDETAKLISSKVILLARTLPEPFKAQENLKKLVVLLEDKNMNEIFQTCVNCECGVKQVWTSVGEIVVKLGSKNVILDTVKALLDRVAPVLVDQESIKLLFQMVKKTTEGYDIDEEYEWNEMEGPDPRIERGFRLISTLASVFPQQFKSPECFEILLTFLKNKDRKIVDISVKILNQIGEGLDASNKSLASYFQPLLCKMAVKGTPHQAKFALHSISKMFKDSSAILDKILESLIENLEFESPLLLTTLTSLGHLAVLSPDLFEAHHKQIIKDFVVKNLLIKDRDSDVYDSVDDDEWCDDVDVTTETQAKVLGIKLLVRWLEGLQNNQKASAMPVLRLLHTMLKHDGDLQSQGHVTMCDRARLRLASACAMLKLAQKATYTQLISQEFFQQLALTMQDTCYEVREAFTSKLHKALDCLKLPLEYMTLFCLAATEPSKERKSKVKQMIERNIATRRNYLKQHSVAAALKYSILPEYSLPHLVYLLAHHPDYDNKSVESLKSAKEYLWFYMEPLMFKADNYSFLKKLLENIKQTKDANNPESTEANEALYSVCDLSIGLILNKPSVFVLKSFPGNPILPMKLFVPMDKSVVNTKVYLPKEFAFNGNKKRTAHLDVRSVPSGKTTPQDRTNTGTKTTSISKGNSRKNKKLNTTERKTESDAIENSSSEYDSEDNLPLASPMKRVKTEAESSSKVHKDTPIKTGRAAADHQSSSASGDDSSSSKHRTTRKKRPVDKTIAEESDELTEITKSSRRGRSAAKENSDADESNDVSHSVTDDSEERITSQVSPQSMETDAKQLTSNTPSETSETNDGEDEVINIKRRRKKRK